MAQTVRIRLQCRRPGFDPWIGMIPGSGWSPREENGYPFQYFCLENPHGQRSLEGYGSWGRRVRQDWATNTLKDLYLKCLLPIIFQNFTLIVALKFFLFLLLHLFISSLCLVHFLKTTISSELHFFCLTFCFILLYNTVLVLPYINMNPPRVYMSSQSWTPPPTSLPIPSLWVIPVHQPHASCILHRTETGDLFLTWY